MMFRSIILAEAALRTSASSPRAGGAAAVPPRARRAAHLQCSPRSPSTTTSRNGPEAGPRTRTLWTGVGSGSAFSGAFRRPRRSLRTPRGGLVALDGAPVDAAGGGRRALPRRSSPTAVASSARFSAEAEERRSSASGEGDGDGDGDSKPRPPPGDTDIASDLTKLIREAWDAGETDGVRVAMSSLNLIEALKERRDADEVARLLVAAATKSAGSDRGRAAGAINAALASCCGGEDGGRRGEPEVALAVLDRADRLHEKDPSAAPAPDLVSLALVYYALREGGVEKYESESERMLERARTMAKKAGGSKRRRSLAAERRRVVRDEGEVEARLKSLCGPDVSIQYESEDIIVVGKPSGVVCYHTKQTSAGKISPSRRKKGRRDDADSDGEGHRADVSLADALSDASVPLSTLNPLARGIVHRLDRGTSGCVVVAKTDEAHLRLVASFFLRRVDKAYLALVPGEDCLDPRAGVRDGAEGAGSEESGKPEAPSKWKVGSTGNVYVPVDGRPARSSYRVVAEYGTRREGQDGSAVSSEAFLLEVKTFTGRKHQVRVHCASLGRPIFFKTFTGRKHQGRAHCASLGRPIFLDSLYGSSTETTGGERKVSTKKGPKKERKKGQNRASGAREVELTMDEAPHLPATIADLAANAGSQRERFFLHALSLSIPEFEADAIAPLPAWWTEVTDRWDDVRS
ncbi:hypothetical protein ACHAWF_003749 [Thalassiosira exigua]